MHTASKGGRRRHGQQKPNDALASATAKKRARQDIASSADRQFCSPHHKYNGDVSEDSVSVGWPPPVLDTSTSSDATSTAASSGDQLPPSDGKSDRLLKAPDVERRNIGCLSRLAWTRFRSNGRGSDGWLTRFASASDISLVLMIRFLDLADTASLGLTSRWFWSLLCAPALNDIGSKLLRPGIPDWVQRHWRNSAHLIVQPMFENFILALLPYPHFESLERADRTTIFAAMVPALPYCRVQRRNLTGFGALVWLFNRLDEGDPRIQRLHLDWLRNSTFDMRSNRCCQIRDSELGASVFHEGAFVVFVNRRRPAYTFHNVDGERRHGTITDGSPAHQAWQAWTTDESINIIEKPILPNRIRLIHTSKSLPPYTNTQINDPEWIVVEPSDWPHPVAPSDDDDDWQAIRFISIHTFTWLDRHGGSVAADPMICGSGIVALSRLTQQFCGPTPIALACCRV
jgi:hypothetical protein